MKAGSSHPAEYLTQLQLNKKRQEKDMHVVETSPILALLLVRPPPVSGPRVCAWLGATHLHNFFDFTTGLMRPSGRASIGSSML